MLKRIAVVLALALLILAPVQSEARKSSGGRTNAGYDGRSKTVHVHGYRKKNGTYVHSYSRRPPKRQK